MSIPFQLTSPAFADGDTIPEIYTCKGRNISPPLRIQGVPAGTDNLALIMHDPDAPRGDYIHWVLWGINPDISEIGEYEVPNGAFHGTTSAGNTVYTGPCPPSGTHHYLFDLYALDAQLDLTEGAHGDEVIDAVKEHLIAKTTLTGIVSAS
jgi:Raf kinase inhibitor-like YbhB/YbcL family protein